ncbi:MAG: hypothetical protein RPU64_13955 [Candidatus Sedimenticola sp. (ex Thyasira tokunagai)]
MRKTGLTLLCFSLLMLAGCSEEKVSPEDEIRAMLSAGEVAVESRSVTESAAFVSEQYQDESGRHRKDIMRLLAGYFLTHQKIHLLVQVNRITLTDDARAEVTLFAAVAGRPESSLEQLVALRADLVRFDLKLEKEGSEWLVHSSHWRRAQQSDFLE